jgi:hypothetical protein
MNYFPTPKAEFIKDPANIANHHKLVESPTLRKHFEVALLEMQRRAAAGTDTTNFNFCAASHLRLLGAQDYLEIFLNLAEQMQPGVKTDNVNLPGNITALPRKNN